MLQGDTPSPSFLFSFAVLRPDGGAIRSPVFLFSFRRHSARAPTLLCGGTYVFQRCCVCVCALCVVFVSGYSLLCFLTSLLGFFSACSSRLGLVGKISYQNRIGCDVLFGLVGGVGVIISRESFLPSSHGRFWYLRSRLFGTQMSLWLLWLLLATSRLRLSKILWAVDGLVDGDAR